MIFIFNYLENGWTKKKKNEKYIFKKKHNNKKEVFSEDYLKKFIEKNFLYGNRLNLIITGKGKRLSVSDGWKGDGKLKKNVPIWLSSTYLSKYILWFDIASPEKGGNGALFVYLKKAKE